MTSRERILNAIPRRDRSEALIPEVQSTEYADVVSQFTQVLQSIGGAVIEVESYLGVQEYMRQHVELSERIVDAVSMPKVALDQVTDPASFDNVEVTLLRSPLAVAENGAVWITDDLLPDRVLPFICQHLMVMVARSNVVATLHQAYEKIGDSSYQLGTFIAGPSKTADIEQSLVLGAHGPKTMTVFLVERDGA